MGTRPGVLEVESPRQRPVPHRHSRWTSLLLAIGLPLVHADSVVVFNEVMYHPATGETEFEWLELHNQMAVDVDLSGWSITGGIDFTFAEGTVIPGGGYRVVAISPAALEAATGLTNVLGPFTGRLSNAGETLRLRNRNQRLMDAVSYGVEGDWPVGPDGAGVSLAKRDPNAASGLPRNWTGSALVDGTPGQRNFSAVPFTVDTRVPLDIDGTWTYAPADTNPDPSWMLATFDDSAWTRGPGLFRDGTLPPPTGDPVVVPTLFSTGVNDAGAVLPPGSADPHYWITLSAQSTPPPPAIPALVIQNHPAWLANDAASSWIGPVNPGTANVAAGNYNYRTVFTLDGFDPSTATLKLRVGADNGLLDVLLNGVSRGLTYEGFATMSGEFTLTGGFAAGTNTLDFLTLNYDTSANPAGFRARVSATAQQSFPVGTTLPPAHRIYLFRAPFTVEGAPRQSALQLRAVIADGAIVYLNGAEVLRINMPSGPVGVETPALSNVVTSAVEGPFALPTGSLVSGTNILAFALHRGPAGGAGVLLGAELSLSTTNILVPPPVELAFNEIGPATNSGFWFELVNHGATALELEGCVLSHAGTTANHEFVFPQTALGAGQLLALTQDTLGFGTDPDDRLFLLTPERDQVLDAVVVKRSLRGRHPDATGPWWRPATPTPGAPNDFRLRNEIVINELMYHPPDIPPAPGGIGTNVLLEITSHWKYHVLGDDLGTSWRTPAFDDRAWPEGPGLFYNTTSWMPAPKNTLLPLTNSAGARLVTWYFRTPFLFQGGTNAAQLILHPIVDDGAVYYLNGVEIHRQNMPDGEITATTLAATSVATAAYTGPWTVPVTNLVDGSNLLAVEVHQFTTNPIAADMVFGLDVSVAGQLIPPTQGGPSPESWVELHNQSSEAVDLTGWQLAGDLDYDFPPGATIPAQGYLVVAGDLASVQSNAPNATVLGPFSGNLRRSGGRVLLRDPSGNPADEVIYADARPWPDAADGGGSSLELRDPVADNARPEAWAASVESSRSAWQTYTYRAVAANRLGPTLWNEFVLGLLDAGECLLDDLRVTENPSGTAVDLLQNGDFESGLSAWRALGNHSQSRVEIDPDNPANHVLHLVATGPTEHLHNHLETTLAGGRSVTDGLEYEVTFRAKWLTGNHRLNTRLYFNRVANTTALARPSIHGTPGRPNSTAVTNLAPTFVDFGHTPVVPSSGQAVTVTVGARDPNGLGSVALRWAVDGGTWRTAAMTPVGPASQPGYTRYETTLPGQAAGALVQIYVQATDGLGATATCPPAGAAARALFRVDRGEALMTQLHRLRLLMTPADAAFLHASTNVMSMDLMRATLVYDERESFYDVGVHLQGSERGRDTPSRVGFTVRLNADHLFRGVQDTITIDRSGGYSGRGGRHDEILLWHAVNHAGGLLGIECDLVQVFAPRQQEDSTGLLRLSAFDGDYFDSQFSNGGDGNLYTLELIYYPLTTTTGDPQAPKLPQPDDVIGTDIQDQGDDAENYRWLFLQENHADQDDYRQVVALSKAFSLTGSALETAINTLVDTDEYLRALAFKAFTGDVDTYTEGYTHNWKFYFRPGDERALGLLWDMDFSFVQSTTSGFPGSASANTYRIVNLPNNRRRYLNHLYDILTRTIHTSHLQPWADHYAGLLGEDWSGAVDYLQERANYIRSRLPLTTTFAITSNGGANFATTDDHVTLTGNAPINVRDLQVNNVLRPVAWTSQTAWTITLLLPQLVSPLTVQGLDNNGNPIPTAVDSITVTNLGTPALRPVVINEWMADNAGPGGFPNFTQDGFPDWFELYNPNAAPVNLAGHFLTDTLSEPAKWPIPTNTIIPGPGFILVWADRQPHLNGTDPNGDLHADFQLSNTGEAIALFAPDGSLQHAVTFGPQLENVSQGLFPDGNTNQYHPMPRWTPRLPNTVEPLPPPTIANLALDADGTLSFDVGGLPHRLYRVDAADDLAFPDWQPIATNRVDLGAIVVSDATGGRQHRYYRVLLIP